MSVVTVRVAQASYVACKTTTSVLRCQISDVVNGVINDAATATDGAVMRISDALHDDVAHYDAGSRTRVHSTKVINQLQFTVVFSKLRMCAVSGKK